MGIFSEFDICDLPFGGFSAPSDMQPYISNMLMLSVFLCGFVI